MHQVVGIEAVVAQVVGEDFEGGEVLCLPRVPGQKLLDGHTQRRLACGVAGEPVAEVAYRADGQQYAFARQRPFEQCRDCVGDLSDRKPPPAELHGGAAVAVGHDRTVAFVDPGRAEGEDRPVGGTERLAQGGPRRVHL